MSTAFPEGSREPNPYSNPSGEPEGDAGRHAPTQAFGSPYASSDPSYPTQVTPAASPPSYNYGDATQKQEASGQSGEGYGSYPAYGASSAPQYSSGQQAAAAQAQQHSSQQHGQQQHGQQQAQHPGQPAYGQGFAQPGYGQAAYSQPRRNTRAGWPDALALSAAVLAFLALFGELLIAAAAIVVGLVARERLAKAGDRDGVRIALAAIGVATVAALWGIAKIFFFWLWYSDRFPGSYPLSF